MFRAFDSSSFQMTPRNCGRSNRGLWAHNSMRPKGEHVYNKSRSFVILRTRRCLIKGGLADYPSTLTLKNANTYSGMSLHNDKQIVKRKTVSNLGVCMIFLLALCNYIFYND